MAQTRSSLTVALANGMTAAVETQLDDATSRHGPVARLEPSSIGGCSTYRLISAASVNSTVVKSTPGQVYGIYLSNALATLAYLKVYDKASAPTEADTPKLTIPIPGSTTVPPRISESYFHGLAFAAGIGFRLTGGLADSDVAAVGANGAIVQIAYV